MQSIESFASCRFVNKINISEDTKHGNIRNAHMLEIFVRDVNYNEEVFIFNIYT